MSCLLLQMISRHRHHLLGLHRPSWKQRPSRLRRSLWSQLPSPRPRPRRTRRWWRPRQCHLILPWWRQCHLILPWRTTCRTLSTRWWRGSMLLGRWLRHRSHLVFLRRWRSHVIQLIRHSHRQSHVIQLDHRWRWRLKLQHQRWLPLPLIIWCRRDQVQLITWFHQIMCPHHRQLNPQGHGRTTICTSGVIWNRCHMAVILTHVMCLAPSWSLDWTINQWMSLSFLLNITWSYNIEQEFRMSWNATVACLATANCFDPLRAEILSDYRIDPNVGQYLKDVGHLQAARILCPSCRFILLWLMGYLMASNDLKAWSN